MTINIRTILLFAILVSSNAPRFAAGDDAPAGGPVEASPEATLAVHHAEPAPAVVDATPATVVEAAPSPPADTTAISIEAIKSQATADGKLSPEAKAEIIELCDKALAKITEAAALSAATASWKKELEEASAELESLQTKPPVLEADLAPATGLTPDELRSRLAAADQRVSAARAESQARTAEIERRAERRKTLPTAITKTREELAKVEEAIKTAPKSDEAPLLAEARRQFLFARREFRQKELQSLEQENRTYEATSRLWIAKRDAAEKRLQLVIEAHKAIQETVSQAQRVEAARQAREARIAAVNAHPAVKAAAAKNAELAERNRAIVSRTQEIQERLAEVRELAQIMQDRRDDVMQRAEASRNSPAFGVMLRSQHDQLPALAPYRDRLRDRDVEISQLGLDIYEWRALRGKAIHVDQAVEETIAKLDASSAETMREEFTAELRRVLEARANILAELIANADDCQARLKDINAAADEVVATTEHLEAYIAERVLWVRSATTLSLDDLRHAGAYWSDYKARARQATRLANALVEDARAWPIWWGLATLGALALILGRGRAKRVLRSTGEMAIKPTATTFRPTVEATLATIFLMLPVSVILVFLGWRLTQAEGGTPRAAGWAIALLGAAYGNLNLVQHASRCGGLGTHHFDWDRKALAAIRHATRSLQFLALPLLAIAVGVEISRDEVNISSIGRLSLIPSLLAVAVICFRLFRPAGALAKALAPTTGRSWGARAVRILAPTTTLAVLALIAASAAGYHYTAMKLTGRAFVSCVFVFGCVAFRSLLMRWLLVAYRRAAMQHAREKRKALQAAQDKTSTKLPAVETQPQVCLSDINQQARKLVGVGAGLAFVSSLWLIWGDLMPALSVLNHVELWGSGLASTDPDAGPLWVTLADLILAFGIFGFTWFAGRNLPGLLEIAVLQKLPLDAGARYAASSVTRYAIMVVGVAMGMRQLGVGWQSVQWLIAAMTVGLGFGLQEIFANFVSGIILLFERPARVGDTVTIGAITGTVTKIQIRATTILDWDNKELIVPNKEFVTGNLVNWTLSNPHLRLIIKVGVAYGSDTRLATELLYKVAHESENVLDNPEPVVVFNEFGDSSLVFELRLFVSDLSLYRRLRHELHLAIDDAFREHGIEIAFPQCDLHIKSMPATAAARGGGRPSAASFDRTEAA